MYINAYMWNLGKWHTHKCKCRSRIDIQKYQHREDLGQGGAGVDMHSVLCRITGGSCRVAQGLQLSSVMTKGAG